VDDRTWTAFTSGEDWKDPALNIAFGARILRTYLDTLGGNIPGAIAAYNAGVGRVRLMLARLEATPAELDTLTTGHNYVQDVLARMAALEATT
jgi:soluble lytic murein transglycosylase-like protein